MVTTQEFFDNYKDLVNRYDKLANEYQILAETLTELAAYNKNIIEEIKYSNTDLALRMMSRVGDILYRNTESLRNNRR